MAWYNILDNAIDANNARKDCNKLEEITKELQDSIESTSNSIQKLITDSEVLFSKSLKKFETSSEKAWEAVSKFQDILQKVQSNKSEHNLQFSKQTIEKGNANNGVTEALIASSSGGIAAVGAYTAVGILGTASTGTAIGTLGGVAATNATLAWFGGGAIAAGGGGIAAGAAVLSGIVAAPVFFVAANEAKKHFENNKAVASKYYGELYGEQASLLKQKEHISHVSTRIKSKVNFLNYISERLTYHAELLNAQKFDRQQKYVTKNQENICSCCIENITQLQNEAVKVLSTPIIVDGEMATTELIIIDLIEVVPEIIQTNWRI